MHPDGRRTSCMGLSDWIRLPRSILTGYLVAAGITLICLGWLAWRQPAEVMTGWSVGLPTAAT
jgi:hypothetical protein